MNEGKKPGKKSPRTRKGTAEKVGGKLVVTTDVTPGPGALQEVFIGGNPEAATQVFRLKKDIPLAELPTLIRPTVVEVEGVPDESDIQPMPDADQISTDRAAARSLTFHAADVVPAPTPADPTNVDSVVPTPDFEIRDSVGGAFLGESDGTKGEQRMSDDRVTDYTDDSIAAAEANRAAIVAAGEAAQHESLVDDDEFAAELAAAEDADAHTLATPIDELVTAATVPTAPKAPIPPQVAPPLAPPPPVFSPSSSPISRPVPPPDFGRRAENPVETAPDTSAVVAAKKGVDAVKAATERRGSGSLKRFMAFAVPIGAAVMATVLSWGHFEPKPAHDQEPAHDLSGLTDAGNEKGTVAEAPTLAATSESVVLPIGAGEGSSQVLAHMGMDQAHIQHALDLPVQIGNVTVPVRDTYVTAKPGELSLAADWNGDQVTGVHYSVGGHQLSAQELSQYLVVSHAQPHEHAPKIASAHHLDSAPASVPDFSADDARIQALLDSIPPTSLAIHEPDALRVATSHAPMPNIIVPMSTPGADYDHVTADSGDLPIKIQRHSFEEAPTQLMSGRPADIRAEEAPTERVEKPISDYPTQMASLDALLKGEKDHTVELATNHFEFRKRGSHYEVRYTRCKTFDLLTPELMTNLERVAHLDFEHPFSVMALTQEEYASVLPEGHPYKELVRKILQMQIDESKGMGLHNVVAEKNLRFVNGEPEPATNQAGQQ